MRNNYDRSKSFSKRVQDTCAKKGRFAAVRNLFSSEHTIKRAVDDITFSVDDGEIVGFIGKNVPRYILKV